MNTERAFEIIAAYGADAGRWPDTERGGVLALAARDAGVAAALAEARGLDTLLAGWARDAAPMDFDVAALVRPRQARRGFAPRRWATTRWIAGGALAAAVAAGIAIFAPLQLPQDPAVQTVSTNSPVLLATAEGDAFGSDAEAFATVFTPTVDEDELI